MITERLTALGIFGVLLGDNHRLGVNGNAAAHVVGGVDDGKLHA